MSLPVHGGLDGLVTLLRGPTVCVAFPDGRITPDRLTGLYHRDVRVLSTATVTFDGTRPTLLAEARATASSSRAVCTLDANAHGDPTAVLVHTREVDTALRDTFEVRVFAGAIGSAPLELELGVDFADLLAMKAGAPAPAPAELRHRGADPGDQQPDPPRPSHWRAERAGARVDIAVDGPMPDAQRGGATGRWRWLVEAAPGRPWSVTVVTRPTAAPAAVDGRPATTSTRSGDTPGQRARRGAPPDATPGLVVDGDAVWQPAIASALDDLHALHVNLPDQDLSYLAAGAPWFMALFGRDALIAGWMSLPTGTTLALDVLDSLARFQGRDHDAHTLEQPGRILHELRTGHVGVFGVAAGQPYYGTADASALFVMLLAEAYRWGADVARIRALLPAARAAVAWCTGDGDLDGDGFVEYAADGKGLANQGWKDSADAMVHRDGSVATGPIALAEVQAYLYRALLDLSRLEADLGDPSRADGLRGRAATLRDRFVASFWLADHRLVAMALDGDKRPLAVASSNIGHCLWAGILPDDLASAAADTLSSPALATAWGLRTLAADERSYNPLSYHLGTIWPHDSALAAVGLMRTAHVTAATAIVDGLLAACAHFDWRLPELFGGFDRHEVHFPVTYPVACSPQAWSAAAPLLLLRTMLRLEPDVPAGRLHLAPVFAGHRRMTISGLTIGADRLDCTVTGDTAEVTTAARGLTLELAPRPTP